MSTTVQTVTLTSSEHFGRKVPSQAFGNLLRVLPEAIRYSIRMAFESRSGAKGQRPAWLAAASDIRFLDHTGEDETILHFEAPRLGEAAPSLYRQQELWSARPRPEDTGFDLLGDVIADVAASNADSERFDRPMLQQLAQFKHGLNGSFQTIEFTGTRYTAAKPGVITWDVIRSAQQLSHDTPLPQRTRIVGRLDMIRNSTSSFAVKLADGQEVRGVLTEGEIGKVTEHFGHEVLVLGRAVFRPSGKLLRIDADEVLPAGERDQFFSVTPKPRRANYDVREALREQQHKRGVSAIFGKWPGDETDEEVERALQEMK